MGFPNMTTPLTPGVYVREAPGGARAIEAAPTAVTIFVGETERGPVGPTPISSPTQFQRIFGGYWRDVSGAAGRARLFMPYAINGFFANGGPRAYVLRLISGADPEAATRGMPASGLAGSEVTDGTSTARITARVTGAAGEDVRIVIADATSGAPTQFNLTVEVSTDGGTTFNPRATSATLENLDGVDGVPNSVATRLATDPDIRWEGSSLRPGNGTVAFVLPAAAPVAHIEAAAPGVWGRRIRIAVTPANDGDVDRCNIIVFYQAPGEDGHREVERFQGLTADQADDKYIVDQLGRSAYIRWSGEAVRPADVGNPEATPPGVGLDGSSFSANTTGGSLGTGGDAMVAHTAYGDRLADLDQIDDAALIVCGSDGMLNATSSADHNNLINAVLSYVDRRPQRDLFLVADAPRSTAGAEVDTNVIAAVNEARNNIDPSDYLGLYWPRITVGDPAGVGRNPTIQLPVAGHIAGLYGRTDGRRGVWKVAAGLEAIIAGAVGLEVTVLDRHQDQMNPHGLNALRTIPGAGRVVWGGRTRRPTTEWRHINVRRTAMFLRKSIFISIQWAVFEGNDERLWAALRESIGAFMEAQFRNGAFAGATSREAYFVKCDSDTTTPDDQAAGIVNVQVGFAPLRPAEFVIVTLSQMTGR